MTQYTPSSSEPGQRPPSFWSSSRGIASWLFTLDHKRIGVMYLAFVWAAFLLGGIFALLVRT
ncbi:MAG TPA: cytochrome c oxidase subunit I, partial [Pseudomonadota bacterium]|nr:cytochrome c oxidase subunit I [Pseudomonadota bacterium]